VKQFHVKVDFETSKALVIIGESVEVASDRPAIGAVKRLVSSLLDQAVEQGLFENDGSLSAKVEIKRLL